MKSTNNATPPSKDQTKSFVVSLPGAREMYLLTRERGYLRESTRIAVPALNDAERKFYDSYEFIDRARFEARLELEALDLPTDLTPPSLLSGESDRKSVV